MTTPLPTTDVGAVAGATEEVAKDVSPVIAQQVSQAYENAFKSRIASIQATEARLIANPSDAAARADFDALFTRLCDDAGFVRVPGGVGHELSISVVDLALCLQAFALSIKQAEQLAANAK